ncbi:MAG: 6-carboxytetrahydropterin synthase [Bdellovibrio sp.]|nr:MAG: 6-carboxytetrahydropterin synthase [Bdellovibrio sp.]
MPQNPFICKKVSFEAGHRLPHHHSKCKNLHGHHYELEVMIGGPLSLDQQSSSYGMVADFHDLKHILKKHILEPWDHAFFVYEKDLELLNFLNSLPEHKTVVTPLPPTAEHLAQLAFNTLNQQMPQNWNLKIVRLYETPTCWAEVSNSLED